MDYLNILFLEYTDFPSGHSSLNRVHSKYILLGNTLVKDGELFS
jgi:hypothetical protein